MRGFQDPLFDNYAHLKTFPDHAIFDIARNESAQRSYRLHAVELLTTRKSPLVKHFDLRELVQELEIELDGIVFEHGTPAGPGPLTSSVTTATMFADGPIPEEVEPEIPTPVETLPPQPEEPAPVKKPGRKPKEKLPDAT